MATSQLTITPVFDFLTNEPEVTLRKGRAKIKIGGDSLEGPGRAILQLAPKPAILFKADIENMSMKTAIRVSLGALTVDAFEFDGMQIEGFYGGMEGIIPSPSVITVWHPSRTPVLPDGSSRRMKRLIFHLFNFRDFKSLGGLSEQRGSTSVAIQRVDLQGADLKVSIKSLFESADQQQSIQRDGGARFTHVGSLERIDGKTFAGPQALEYLWQLEQFLSFANGSACIPVCSCGFDGRGKRMWEAWTSPAVNPRSADSWFDILHCDQLTTFFDCFLKTKTKDVWKRPLQDAIYWYLRANSDSGGIDSGIILAQAALELLAYAHVVEDKGLLSAKGFKELWASDNLRLLLVSNGIPTRIPSDCKQITSLTRRKTNRTDWKDLPHALTDIRNSLVHPDNKHRHKLGDAYVDAWKASLWLIELAILGICGYVGTYSNRLKNRRTGNVEDVPWK